MNSRTLHKISYGMYVISSVKEGKFNGQIANTVFQITSEPATIAISINKQNLTHEYISASKIFAAAVLSENTPLKFIGKFGFKSGREIDKFEDTEFKTEKTGTPIVTENAVAYLEAEIINSLDAGTHTVFLGRVVGAEILNDEKPMTYAYYHQVKNGSAPKTAPTYIKREKEKIIEEKKSGASKKYVCMVCGYIYDPDKGDPDDNIPPGTPFDKLPEDWTCPVCGAGKDEFEKLNTVIIGISKDSPKSHVKFIDKHNLSILILSDEEHKVLETYGVWGKKKNYGREYFGIVRSTFIIDPDGKIRKEWKKVRVAGHVDAVLDTLKKLIEESP